VAVADTVSANEANEGYYEFDRLVSRGGHATYRLFVESSPEAVERELESLGCRVEKTAGGKLLAVDVPPIAKIRSAIIYSKGDGMVVGRSKRLLMATDYSIE